MRKLTPDLLDELRRRRAEGESLRSIGRALGISHERVRQVLVGTDPKPARKRVAMPGEVFNRLMVLSEWKRSVHGQRQVLCRCECGKLTVVAAATVAGGLTKSCGCLQSELCGRRRLITIKGRTQHLAAWLREVRLSDRCFRLRLRAGLTVEDAITRPPQEGRRLDGRKKRKPTQRRG